MKRLTVGESLRRVSWGLLPVFLGLLVCARPAFSQEAGETVLATVDGKPITAREFLEELAKSGPGRSAEQARALLDRMIRFRMIHTAAVKEGYEQDPDVVEGLRMLIVNKYVADHLEGQTGGKVSKARVEQYYREHPEEFSSPGAVRAAVIFISVPPGAGDREKERLRRRAESAREEALRLPQSIAGFGEVALKYSDHTASRAWGGDVGWLSRGKPSGRWPARVDEALFALSNPGNVSQVVPAEDGFYLVKLMQSRRGSKLSLADATPRIEQKLSQPRKPNHEGHFIEQLKKEIPVTVNESALEEILRARKTGAAH